MEGSVGVLGGAGLQQTVDQSDDELTAQVMLKSCSFMLHLKTLELFLVICPAMINYLSGVSPSPRQQ